MNLSHLRKDALTVCTSLVLALSLAGSLDLAQAQYRPPMGGPMQPGMGGHFPGSQPGMPRPGFNPGMPGMGNPAMPPGMRNPGMQPGMIPPMMGNPGMPQNQTPAGMAPPMMGNPGMMPPGMNQPQPGMMPGGINQPQPGMMPPGMNQPQPGMMPPGANNPGLAPPVMMENIYKCDTCGAEIGRGSVMPNLSHCPKCGIRFKNTAAGQSARWGGGGYAAGGAAGVVTLVSIVVGVLLRIFRGN